jgi:hypothetical protein
LQFRRWSVAPASTSLSLFIACLDVQGLSNESKLTANGYVKKEEAARHYRKLRDELYHTRQMLLTAREEAWEQRQHCETALRFLAAYSQEGFRAYQREIA